MEGGVELSKAIGGEDRNSGVSQHPSLLEFDPFVDMLRALDCNIFCNNVKPLFLKEYFCRCNDP